MHIGKSRRMSSVGESSVGDGEHALRFKGMDGDSSIEGRPRFLDCSGLFNVLPSLIKP